MSLAPSADILDEKAAGAPVERPRERGRASGVKLLAETLRGYAGRAVAGIATGLAWTCCKLAVPVFLRRGLDLGIRAGDGAALRQAVLGIAIVAAMGAGFAGLRRYLAQSLAARLETDLRARLFAHLLRLDLAFHARSPAGYLVSRAVSDLQQIQQPFVNVPITVSNAVMFVGSLVALASIDPALAAVALGPTLGVFVVARWLTALQGPRVRALQHALGSLASTVEEAIAGIRSIKGLGLETVERARVQARSTDAYAAAMRVNRVRATVMPVLDVLPALGLVAVLWFGGERVIDGRLTVGRLVQFNYYVLLLVNPLRMTGITIAQMQRALVSANAIAALLALSPTIVDPPHAQAQTPTPGPSGTPGLAVTRGRERSGQPRGAEIRFESVDFTYADGKVVFRKLDLHVRAGETVAIAGATGSGKSTLLALLARFHDVCGGRVVVDGVDVRGSSIGELRVKLGIVFEDPFLFSGSIRHNIAFAAPGASVAEVQRAARAAGAHDFIIGFEDGYDAPVGERGLSLSGGERQRIALARALLTDPPILVLDQATAAVDAAKEEEIRGALASVMRGRTTLLVAHRPATLRMADRVLLLDGGGIADTGTHSELLARSTVYRNLLALEAPGLATGTAPSERPAPSDRGHAARRTG
ncbi:MAG: ABC transporter ATP-binding protein [Polyangiaceae bacterium]|jgi:ATP-binding cassette subfamily B protein